MRAASGGCDRPCSPASRPTCAEGYGGSTDVGSKLRDRGRPRRDEAPRWGRGAGSVRPPPHPAPLAGARPGGAHVGDRGRRRRAARGRGGGRRRLRHPGHARPADGDRGLLDAPAAGGRPVRLRDVGAAGDPGRRRQRRQLRRARRGALRRRRGLGRRGHAHARHRDRRRARARRAAAAGLDRRGRRARPHGRRHGRPALPGRVPEPRLPRGDGLGLRARARGVAARRAAARHGARAWRWRRAASSPARS